MRIDFLDETVDTEVSPDLKAALLLYHLIRCAIRIGYADVLTSPHVVDFILANVDIGVSERACQLLRNVNDNVKGGSVDQLKLIDFGIALSSRLGHRTSLLEYRTLKLVHTGVYRLEDLSEILSDATPHGFGAKACCHSMEASLHLSEESAGIAFTSYENACFLLEDDVLATHEGVSAYNAMLSLALMRGQGLVALALRFICSLKTQSKIPLDDKVPVPAWPSLPFSPLVGFALRGRFARLRCLEQYQDFITHLEREKLK